MEEVSAQLNGRPFRSRGGGRLFAFKQEEVGLSVSGADLFALISSATFGCG